LPESPEAQREITEIKREVQEIRQAQDAQFHQNRQKWEDYLLKSIGKNENAIRILLAIDGTKSAKDLEQETGIYQVKCWRILDKLQKDGIIFRLPETKNGSPIYAKSRWYRVLRLDDLIVDRVGQPVTQGGTQPVPAESAELAQVSLDSVNNEPAA